MKLKKILVSILVPLNSINEINEKIGDDEINNDVLGFHIVLTNKISKKFAILFDNSIFTYKLDSNLIIQIVQWKKQMQLSLD